MTTAPSPISPDQPSLTVPTTFPPHVIATAPTAPPMPHPVQPPRPGEHRPVRRGRHQVLTASDYQPIEVLAHAAALAACSTVEDMLALLDPERVSRVLGVTEHAAFDSPQVAAWGEKLWTNGVLGADLLVVPPRSGFPPHVHPGHHLLLCVAGAGTFSVDRATYPARPGEMHMIEGGVPHAVGNPHDTPHVLIAFGAPPRELDAPDRMRVVQWNGSPVHAPVD